jgi:signal transduction histidine kinase
MNDRLVPGRRCTACVLSILTIAVIAASERLLGDAAPFRVLYVTPVLIAAGSVDRRVVTLAALLCAALSDGLQPRLGISLATYLACGLLILELRRRRESEAVRFRDLAGRFEIVERAERQWRSLVHGSPAAILTVEPAGKILIANESAHALLNCERGVLVGQMIDRYVPTLAAFRRPNSMRRLARTLIECTATRHGGETFLANVWVSSAGPPDVTGLIVAAFDASQQLRNHQEIGFHTLALSARVMAGSYRRETRALGNAVRRVTTSLQMRSELSDVEEVEALASLATGLEKLAAVVPWPREQSAGSTSLRAVLDHFRIVVEPWFEESEIEVAWQHGSELPVVRGDHHALLHVFLGIARNAQRALEECSRREFRVSATVETAQALVRFRNSGVRPPEPEALFQPFHPAAADFGIGLHLSRAIVRSFGGELRYEPTDEGYCFAVMLEPAVVSMVLGGVKV